MACETCGGSGRRTVMAGDKIDVSPCPDCCQAEIREDEERAKRSSFKAWKKRHGKEGIEYVPARTRG